MTDFNQIYGPTSKSDEVYDARVKANTDAGRSLFDAINRSDFDAAAKTLQKAGSCNWGEITSIAEKSSVSRQYSTHFTYDKDKISIEILKREDYGNLKRTELLIPKLTVTSDSCDKTKK